MDIESIREFRENLRHFERELNTQNNSSCCCNVTVSQCHTLMELNKSGKIFLNELSVKLNLDKSTVSRIVESLVNIKLVKREIPKSNRRKTIISLTEEGRRICKEINSGNDKYYLNILESIPVKKRNVFLESFELFIKAMKQQNNNQITSD